MNDLNGSMAFIALLLAGLAAPLAPVHAESLEGAKAFSGIRFSETSGMPNPAADAPAVDAGGGPTGKRSIGGIIASTGRRIKARKDAWLPPSPPAPPEKNPMRHPTLACVGLVLFLGVTPMLLAAAASGLVVPVVATAAAMGALAKLTAYASKRSQKS